VAKRTQPPKVLGAHVPVGNGRCVVLPDEEFSELVPARIARWTEAAGAGLNDLCANAEWAALVRRLFLPPEVVEKAFLARARDRIGDSRDPRRESVELRGEVKPSEELAKLLARLPQVLRFPEVQSRLLFGLSYGETALLEAWAREVRKLYPPEKSPKTTEKWFEVEKARRVLDRLASVPGDPFGEPRVSVREAITAMTGAPPEESEGPRASTLSKAHQRYKKAAAGQVRVVLWSDSCERHEGAAKIFRGIEVDTGRVSRMAEAPRPEPRPKGGKPRAARKDKAAA
jgi:hypothetical protein